MQGLLTRLTLALLALTPLDALAVTPDRLFQPYGLFERVQPLLFSLLSQIDIETLDRLHPATSIGQVADGRLLFGTQMRSSHGVHVRVPRDSWGVPEAMWGLRAAARHVRELHPGGPDVMVGDLSTRSGGKFPPHHTHRNGRDVDLRYFIKGQPPLAHDYRFSSRYSIDPVRQWAFIKYLVDNEWVSDIYMDYKLQKVVWKHARSLGFTARQLEPIFSWPRARNHPDAVVKHVKGHHNHIHLRFHAPLASWLGTLWSPERVQGMQRRLDIARVGHFEHVVQPGDTLGAIAEQHAVRVNDLMAWNRLRARSVLRPGRVLKVRTNN